MSHRERKIPRSRTLNIGTPPRARSRSRSRTPHHRRHRGIGVNQTYEEDDDVDSDTGNLSEDSLSYWNSKMKTTGASTLRGSNSQPTVLRRVTARLQVSTAYSSALSQQDMQGYRRPNGVNEKQEKAKVIMMHREAEEKKTSIGATQVRPIAHTSHMSDASPSHSSGSRSKEEDGSVTHIDSRDSFLKLTARRKLTEDNLIGLLSNDRHCRSKVHRLLSAVPSFSSLPARHGTVFRFEIGELTPEQMWGDQRLPMTKRPIQLRMATHPFAEGTERLAYHGIDQSYVDMSVTSHSSASSSSIGKDSPSGKRVVLKEYKFRGKGQNKLQRYLAHMEAQSVAARLAQEFCKAGVHQQLKFCKATVVAFDHVDDHGQPTGEHTYYICEPYVQGKYVKYSNNFGYVSNSHGHDLADAFSHFTHDYSGGHLMVVDLQGVNFLLTDPALHSTNRKRFGRTNFGVAGMNAFFKTHVCNKVCRNMKLKQHPIQPTSK